MSSCVTISIVNFNHARYLPACLDAVRAQSLAPADVVVTDNASSDDSVSWLRQNAGDVRLLDHRENLGYARGHNLAFESAQTPYVMALNCDVVLDRDFLRQAVAAMDSDDSIGCVCGRLYKGLKGESEVLDSTGLFPDRFRRFKDRDTDQLDRGQRMQIEFVFGASGSAVVFCKEMLSDVSIHGEIFDEDFFAYYEDADLAWRALRRGWKALFVPEARGWHVHDNLSRTRSGRRDAPAVFRQMLLARNRHLCILKNESRRDLLRAAPALLAYDAALQAYLTKHSYGLAVRWPISMARLLPVMARKRAAIYDNASADVCLADWFDRGRVRPASSPCA